MTTGLTKMKMMDISEMLFRDDGRLVTDINSFFAVTVRQISNDLLRVDKLYCQKEIG
jgi:hypothetical protein